MIPSLVADLFLLLSDGAVPADDVFLQSRGEPASADAHGRLRTAVRGLDVPRWVCAAAQRAPALRHRHQGQESGHVTAGVAQRAAGHLVCG